MMASETKRLWEEGLRRDAQRMAEMLERNFWGPPEVPCAAIAFGIMSREEQADELILVSPEREKDVKEIGQTR